MYRLILMICPRGWSFVSILNKIKVITIYIHYTHILSIRARNYAPLFADYINITENIYKISYHVHRVSVDPVPISVTDNLVPPSNIYKALGYILLRADFLYWVSEFDKNKIIIAIKLIFNCFIVWIMDIFVFFCFKFIKIFSRLQVDYGVLVETFIHVVVTLLHWCFLGPVVPAAH